MAISENSGDVKTDNSWICDPLLTQGPASAKSKFLFPDRAG